MPDIQDDTPRLAEIARTLQDFRYEFRDAMNSVVRKDVYMADMRTLETRLEAVVSENRRLGIELEKERTERRNTSARYTYAMFVAGLSLLGTIITMVVK